MTHPPNQSPRKQGVGLHSSQHPQEANRRMRRLSWLAFLILLLSACQLNDFKVPGYIPEVTFNYSEISGLGQVWGSFNLISYQDEDGNGAEFKQDELSQLPPDPGEVGKATLGGVDSDNDGLRDDVQRYLYQRYPTQDKIREALVARAIITQAMLPALQQEDTELFLDLTRNRVVVTTCLRERFARSTLANEDLSIHLKDLDHLIANTVERYLLYETRFQYYDGRSYDIPEQPCSFI